jgi:predicted phage terminase large subunit-like protein
MMTGAGGNRRIIDDPHNVLKGESDNDRKQKLDWFDLSFSTRANNPTNDALVMIGQRVHHNDLTGHVLKREAEDWVWLKIPMEYERECDIPQKERDLMARTKPSPVPWVDPREEKGQLLEPKRFPREEVNRIKKRLGQYGTAAQFQQRPSPREGGVVKVDNILTILPQDFNRHFVVKSVRYWDKAGTEDGGARTAGVLMHKMREGYAYSIVVENVIKGQWSYGGREKRIKQVAEMDAAAWDEGHGPRRDRTKTWVEQEPGSGGKESAQRTVRMLRRAGHIAHAEIVRGDKETRMEPFGIATETPGEVVMVQGEWNGDYRDELRDWPNGEFKDQGDATSGAYNQLHDLGNDKPKRAGAPFQALAAGGRR